MLHYFLNPTLHGRGGKMAHPERNQLLCIRYCILRDLDWLTIPIYPYIWQFFLCWGQKLSRKSFRVPFLRQGSKSKILDFKKKIHHPQKLSYYSGGYFHFEFFCFRPFYVTYGHFKTIIANISEIKGDPKKIYYPKKS